MKRNILMSVFLFIIITLICTFAIAEEEPIELAPLVVTATRTPVPAMEMAGSVTVLGEYDFSIMNDYEVLQALRGRFGIDIVQSGGVGRTTSAFIRGASPGQTLVLIDGQRVNSPLTGDYDFADMLLDDVYQVEIVRGPVSTLYGSDAIGGIINIIPKKGEGPFKAVLSAEAGSFYTFHEHASISQGFEKADYYLSVSRIDSDGSGEDDIYQNTYLSLNTGWTPTDTIELRVLTRYTDSKVGIDDYDPMTYTVINDPNSTQKKEAFFLSGRCNISFTDRWESLFLAGYYNEKLRFEDTDNPGDPYLNNAEFKSDVISIDWQNNITLCDRDLLTVGLEVDELKGENIGSFDESIRETAVYANNQLDITENLRNISGVRFDDNEQFGDKWTGRTALNLDVPTWSMMIYGSIGTGFKAPTLNDLYFPGYGDSSLEPETSTGFEIGVKKSFFEKKMEIILSGYYMDFDDLIGIEATTDPMYTFGVKAANIDSAKSKGVELLLSYTPCDPLSLSLSYTLDKTEDDATGKELLRRPENKFMLSADWNPVEKLFIGARVRYVGKRLNIADSYLENYVTVDVSASYVLRQNIEIYVRGENIFNENYEEALGYKAPSAAVYAGVKVEL